MTANPCHATFVAAARFCSASVCTALNPSRIPHLFTRLCGTRTVRCCSCPTSRRTWRHAWRWVLNMCKSHAQL